MAEAGLHLRKVMIPLLVQKLDKLDIVPVDSISITQAFHTHGINMRYLGIVAQLTNIPHVKDICLIEMCARSSK